MIIHTFILGQLQTNCHLVFDQKTKEAVIVDPADSGDFLTQKILELKLKPKFILATHGHFDHVLGSLGLKLNFQIKDPSEVAKGFLRGEITGTIPFCISQKDAFLLPLTRKSAFFWTKVDPQLEPAKPDKFLKEGDIIKFGNEELKVMETPGHTPGGLSFYHQKARALFSGDTIFKNAIGRTDLPYCSQSQLETSIQKLLKLPNSTVIYPGHGQNSTIEEFKKYFTNNLNT